MLNKNDANATCAPETTNMCIHMCTTWIQPGGTHAKLRQTFPTVYNNFCSNHMQKSQRSIRRLQLRVTGDRSQNCLQIVCDVTDTAAQRNFQIMDNDTVTFLYLDKSNALEVIIIIIIPNKRHESIRGGEVVLHSQPCTRGM